MIFSLPHLLLLATLLRPAAPLADSTLSAVSTRADPGLILVARTSLAAFALLGLLAYAKRRQPGNGDGVRQPSRGATNVDAARSTGGWTVARRSHPGVHRVTATLDAAVLDAGGAVVIPAGAVVELTITEVPQTAAAAGGTVVLDVTGVMVHVSPSSDGADHRLNGRAG